MTRFTPLESDILDALAWDLRDIAPDLGGQFAEALPGDRRNTGSGLFTELIVDRSRPPPLTTPTGRFGTVHAMVGDLPDPIAFQVELRQGRLLSLHGDAYGQDTRAIDFARVPYDQIFTLNDQGDSIAFDPVALMQPSALLDLHRHTDHEPASTPVPPPLVNLGALQKVQEPGPTTALDVLFGKVVPVTDDTQQAPAGQAERTSVLVALWVVIGLVSLLAVALFDAPVFLVFFLAMISGRLLQKPKALDALAAMARQLGAYEYRPPQR